MFSSCRLYSPRIPPSWKMPHVVA
uniref:Uncharacterized protein n=1 Tax=Arundo donax TaxID=35708 RepID=A0A0A9C1K4_ARUDO